MQQISPERAARFAKVLGRSEQQRVFAPESRAGGLGWPVRLLREPAQLHTDPRAEEDAEHEGQAAHGQKRHSAEAV